MESIRRGSGGLPPRARLSASNSHDHLQRLSSSGVLSGASPALIGGHVGAFAAARSVSGSIAAHSPRALGSGTIGDAFQSGSFGGSTGFSSAGAVASVFSTPAIDTRLGSLDMALMGSRQAAPIATTSADLQRLHSLTAEGAKCAKFHLCYHRSSSFWDPNFRHCKLPPFAVKAKSFHCILSVCTNSVARLCGMSSA